jgi:hypothetical protein
MNTGSRLLRVLLLTVIAAAIVWLGMWASLAPFDLERAAQQAAELQSLIRRQPQFSDVQVSASTNGKLLVFAPNELSSEAKAELEVLVAQHAPDPSTPVSYLVPISDELLQPK